MTSHDISGQSSRHSGDGGGDGVFIGSDSCMKLALPDAPLFQLVLMRGIASVSISLPVLLLLGHGGGLKRMFNPLPLAGANLTAKSVPKSGASLSKFIFARCRSKHGQRRASLWR